MIRQEEEIYLTDLDEDKVMMDMKTGNYFILNAIGSDILGRVKTFKKVRDLVEELVREYEVDRETCSTQVMAYLSILYELHLIQIQN